MKAVSRYVLAAGLIAFATPSAWAELFRIDFSGSGFVPSQPGLVTPQDPISGSFVVRAASLASPIEELLAVDLTINGHAYALAEVDFANDGNLSMLGGKVGGVAIPMSGADDFLLTIGRPFGADSFNYVYYTTSSAAGRWVAGGDGAGLSSIAVTPVPEPIGMVLFGTGLVGLAATRKRDRRPLKSV